MKKKSKWLFVGVLMLMGHWVSAQFNQGKDFRNRNIQKSKTSTQDSLSKVSIPDSLILRYFKMSDITKYYNFKDSTLDHFFHQYDPAKRRWIDYQNLGNAGSASRNPIFVIKPYIGFDMGLHQYDLYNFKLDDFRFFENNVPHSNVFFSPIDGQKNFVIRSDFARSFNDGTSISLNYRRIRQQGFYTNQLTKITNFGAALRFQSKNERYTGFLSMVSNINEEGQNGGVLQDTFYNISQLSDRTTVDIASEDAQTRHQQKQYSIISYYQLNNPTKSYTKLLLRYDLSYDQSYYKFTDESTSTSIDSVNYQQFLVEDRGIKFYNQVNKIRNAAYAYVSNGNRLNIRAGLIYDHYSIDQLGTPSTFKNLYADFIGGIPITKDIAIASQAQIGIGDGAGDFNIKGSLNLNLGKWINLTGGATIFRYSPDLTSKSLVLNGNSYWTNDFSKPFGTDIFGSFEIPFLKIKGKIKQTLINNPIYYNKQTSAKQWDGVFSVSSITLANEFRIGGLGMENYLMAQFFSDNLYNLPRFTTKHNVHYQRRVFRKVLLARIGAEFRFQPAYTGVDYSPVIGQFYQSDIEMPFYPMTDVYLSGKLQKFRIFLRFENITNLWNPQVQYQVAHYPQFDFKFRLGISWLLID